MATVSNPYTFKIIRNKTVKCTISTIAVSNMAMDIISYSSLPTEDQRFTIPSGITKIKVNNNFVVAVTPGNTYYFTGRVVNQQQSFEVLIAKYTGTLDNLQAAGLGIVMIYGNPSNIPTTAGVSYSAEINNEIATYTAPS